MPKLDGTGTDAGKVKSKQALEAFQDAAPQDGGGSGQGESGKGYQDETGRSSDYAGGKK